MSHRFHHGPLVAQHTERVFPEPAVWGVLTLLVVLLAIALAGCTTITQTNGAEKLTATALFTNLSAASDCAEGVDPDTGTPTSSTHHTLTTQGDAASLHEAGGMLGSLLAFAGKLLPVPVPAARGALPRAVPSPAGSPAVTSCTGEHTTRTAADPVDHADQPELLRLPGDRR